MTKYVLVVSPDFPNLYADLAHDFKDDPAVDVIVDRRMVDRRSATVSLPSGQRERRHRERRINPPSRNDMSTLGYVLVRRASA
jgi:hypothetical protein